MTKSAIELDLEATNLEHRAQTLRGEAAAQRGRDREECRRQAQAIPVDRSDVTLTDGSPVTADHREHDPKTGMQKGYVVLSDAERAKGFVRPVRESYRHVGAPDGHQPRCNSITTMGRRLAETYARDPFFYSGTFCARCGGHFPVGEDGEFIWYENDGSEGPRVGT